jgi:transposase-like protein
MMCCENTTVSIAENRVKIKLLPVIFTQQSGVSPHCRYTTIGMASSLLQDLRTRGATQIDLIGTFGHDGLLAAVQELFPSTPRQRCLLHKQRNVLTAVPRRVRQEVETELGGIWAQPTKEGAVTQLAAFKAK